MAVDVRWRFKEIPGIMESTGMPEYSRVVDRLAHAALNVMTVRSLS
jgi:Na+/H+-translocating membrane pyrophosphatase